MANRVRRWQPIGRWLREAREQRRLTRQQLSHRTGISVPSLARFETNQAEPSFGDVCVIARDIGWPLLRFADGRTQSGHDTRSMLAQLYHWGLQDLQQKNAVLIGEVHPFEDVLSDSVMGVLSPRVVEGLPALLLARRFVPSRIASRTQGIERARLGWLADIALHISLSLPLEHQSPDAPRCLNELVTEGKATLSAEGRGHGTVDDLRGSAFLDQSLWDRTPPLTRRWNIASDISLDDFTNRAVSVFRALP